MDAATREYYSVQADETNPLTDGPRYHSSVDRSTGTVQLSDPRIVKVDRIRLLGCSRDFPFWDVSYAVARLADGRLVPLDLGSSQLSRNYRADLISLCKAAGRYGKSLGIFEAVSLLPG